MSITSIEYRAQIDREAKDKARIAELEANNAWLQGELDRTLQAVKLQAQVVDLIADKIKQEATEHG